MRTTITLDPDVAALIERAMREQRLTFKAAVNEAIRRGLAARRSQPTVRTPTFSMGEPLVPLTKALDLAAELEDEETVRELSIGR